MKHKRRKNRRTLNRRVLFFIVAVSCFVLSVSSWAQEGSREAPRFFSTLNDVPLMDGLEELIDQSVVFDKAEGRIIESAAAGNDMAAEKIRDFYERTLPQLGWVKKENGRYVRQDEVLEISIDKETGYSVIHVMVSPR